MTIDIQLLGPFSVRVDGVITEVRGDYPRAILARLALSAGEVVPVETLIDDVWEERPDQVLSTLRAHISRMRTAFLGDRLIGNRSGYLLDVPPASVDLLRFRASQRALSERVSDVAHLAKLMELGAASDRDVLPGLDRHPFVPRLRTAVLDERRMIDEDLGDASLELGDHGLATATLADTVERHPLHERPVRLLATALARSARTSDALATIDAYRDRLDAHGGLAPSPRLESLRASIVRLDPDVVDPVPEASTTVRRVGVAIPLTRFLGRGRELTALRRLRHLAPLITLVGPAGVGKTRLAVEIAREATRSLDDEQYMVDLADVADPGDVVAAIASVVRATEFTLEAAARRLQGSRTLLILDNADHVLGALAIAVDRLLDRVGTLRVLVTSREPLRLAVEHVVIVRPLIDDDADDAWQLFQERAADARGGASFEDGEAAAARRLCEALEGVPLAIELAAARLDLLGVEQVREGIGTWTGSERRHDSLRSAIAWTFDLLDPADRRVLVELSRFAGPFTAEAVGGVCEVDGADARATLHRLVGKSLVAVDRRDTGRRRFRLLESMREFLTALDLDAHDGARWRSRHRRWFADLAVELAPALRTFAARDAMAVLDGFRADLAMALDDCLEHDERENAVRLAGGQAHYWFMRGLMRDGRDRLDRALATPGAERVRLEAAANLELANLAFQTGDAAGAFDAIGRARSLAETSGEVSVTVVALARDGYGRSIFGDLTTGRALMEDARARLSEAQPWARSEFAMAHGQLLRSLGRLDEALVELTESHRIASSIGYTWMITSARYVMAKTLLDSHRPRNAIDIARNAVAGARAAEDPAGALALVHVIAGACAFVERHEIGARLLGAVDELGLRYDYRTTTAEGAEAQRLRDAIAAGLTAAEFEREYRHGARLGWEDMVQLLDRLPRAEAAVTRGLG